MALLVSKSNCRCVRLLSGLPQLVLTLLNSRYKNKVIARSFKVVQVLHEVDVCISLQFVPLYY